MSLRAYARHRKVSVSSVRQAIRAGRLLSAVVRDDHGRPKISSADLADEEWKRLTRSEYVSPKYNQMNGTVHAPGGRLPLSSVDGVDSASLFADSRARRERANAELVELRLAKERGDYVRVKDVTDKVTSMILACRSYLLALPSKLKSQLPHLTLADLASIDNEIRHALDHLAQPGFTMRAIETSHLSEEDTDDDHHHSER